MLLVLALLLSSATAQLVFNNPEFACGRPKKFLTECSDVAELEKPLFYTCHSGETRDRLIDLQIAKAFLNEEGTSLSCDTINWLNSRTGNAHCTPVKTQKSKTKFFGWLLNEEKETIDCSAADFITKVKDTADCFLAGAVKDKCNRRGDTPLLPGFGCCDLDEYDIRENTIFYRASGSERVVDDLEELDRFIQFKVNELALKCPVKAGAHPRSHASKKKETPAKHKKPAVRKRHTTDKASKRHPLDMGHHQT